jgi:hypothetical protein
LHTVGIIDDRERFQREARHAFDLLEMALLCMDSTVKKNQGRIMAIKQQEREQGY